SLSEESIQQGLAEDEETVERVSDNPAETTSYFLSDEELSDDASEEPVTEEIAVPPMAASSPAKDDADVDSTVTPEEHRPWSLLQDAEEPDAATAVLDRDEWEELRD